MPKKHNTGKFTVIVKNFHRKYIFIFGEQIEFSVKMQIFFLLHEFSFKMLMMFTTPFFINFTNIFFFCNTKFFQFEILFYSENCLVLFDWNLSYLIILVERFHCTRARKLKCFSSLVATI